MPLTSDEENECDSTTPPRPTKKRKQEKDKDQDCKGNKQTYRSEWTLNTKLFGKDVSLWLRPEPGDQCRARCSWCDSSVVANTSTIENHEKSLKHQKQSTKRRTNQSILSFATKGPQADLKHKQAVSRAEIVLAGCFAAHNIPMKFMDHLVPVLKSVFPDSSICKGVEMKRLKCTRILTNVIAATHKEDLSQILQGVKFSVLTDESTHFNVKTAAVAVRFYDKNAGRIVTKFWDLSDVFPKGDFQAARDGANADRLFQLLIGAFEKKNISTENFIGFASDGANVMLGVNDSVMTRLEERCPGIVIMRCVCHSLNLAGKDALKALPRSLEDLARNTHSLFKHSSKRVAQFAEFQLHLEVAEHKMLSLALTRWLCLRENVDRILEQWDALREYLVEHRKEDNTHGSEMLFTWLNDPLIKAYYLFLSWVLPKISAMNAYFQHGKVVVTSLHEKMAQGFKELLSSFMKPIYINRTPLEDLNPHQRDMHSPLANLYLGVKVSEQLKHPEITAEQIDDFRNRCKN